MRETDREGGDKGQAHTIKLCSVGLQRPTSYSHAMGYKSLSSLPCFSSLVVTENMSRYWCFICNVLRSKDESPASTVVRGALKD